MTCFSLHTIQNLSTKRSDNTDLYITESTSLWVIYSKAKITCIFPAGVLYDIIYVMKGGI